MHFGERYSQLLPFSEYVFALGKSPVEVQPEILDIILLRKVYVVYMDWQADLLYAVKYIWREVSVVF
jgi:hypothetical protein